MTPSDDTRPRKRGGVICCRCCARMQGAPYFGIWTFRTIDYSYHRPFVPLIYIVVIVDFFVHMRFKCCYCSWVELYCKRVLKILSKYTHFYTHKNTKKNKISVFQMVHGTKGLVIAISMETRRIICMMYTQPVFVCGGEEGRGTGMEEYLEQSAWHMSTKCQEISGWNGRALAVNTVNTAAQRSNTSRGMIWYAAVYKTDDSLPSLIRSGFSTKTVFNPHYVSAAKLGVEWELGWG